MSSQRFTKDNTEGYTAQQLVELNRRYEWAMMSDPDVQLGLADGVDVSADLGHLALLQRIAERAQADYDTELSELPLLHRQLATQDTRHTLPTDPTPEELRHSRQVLRDVLLPRWWQFGRGMRQLYLQDMSDGEEADRRSRFQLYVATRFGEIVDLTFHVACVLRLPLAYQSYLVTDQDRHELEELLSIALRARITLRWLP